MPQLVQLPASLSIWVYANDHAPPHFHLIGPDTNAMIGIADLRVIRGSFRRRDLRLAIAWVLDHRDELARTWREQNDGDR